MCKSSKLSIFLWAVFSVSGLGQKTSSEGIQLRLLLFFRWNFLLIKCIDIFRNLHHYEICKEDTEQNDLRLRILRNKEILEKSRRNVVPTLLSRNKTLVLVVCQFCLISKHLYKFFPRLYMEEQQFSGHLFW